MLGAVFGRKAFGGSAGLSLEGDVHGRVLKRINNLRGADFIEDTEINEGGNYE